MAAVSREHRDEGRTPGTQEVPKSGDHMGWAEWWGLSCLRAMAAYIEDGNPLDLGHAVRSSKLAWWHICRAKNYRYWDERYREVR